MYLMIVLSAVVGAGLFFAGWYLGDWLERRKSQNPIRKKKRKLRPPKCYVVVPGGPDKEQKKKRKKRSASGDTDSVDFPIGHIKGVDVQI